MSTIVETAAASVAAIAVATVEAIPFANSDDITLAGEMVASAKAMATCLDTAEGEVIAYAKDYGQRRAVLQFNRNVAAASLDKSDKEAIGFKDLAANSAAKRRLSQWHSRFRTIAEAWDSMSETDKADLLQGRASFLSVYDRLKKAEKEAAKASDKAAKEAADAISNANPSPVVSLSDMALALAAALEAASDDEREAAGEGMALLLDTVNGIYNVATVEEVETLAA